MPAGVPGIALPAPPGAAAPPHPADGGAPAAPGSTPQLTAAASTPHPSELRHPLQAMQRMADWLEADKERREVLLVVKKSMKRLNSEYTFQREDGLRMLLHLLHKLQGTRQAASWDDPVFFRSDGRTDTGDLGSDPGVTVTENILHTCFPKTHVNVTTHPLGETSATQRGLAMACLEGLAVLSRREQKAFFAHRGIMTVRDELVNYQELIRPLRDPEVRWVQAGMMGAVKEAVPLLCAALDALLVACLDSPAAQGQVMDLEMPKQLCACLMNRATDVDLRYKILEFLSVLLRMCQLGDSVRGVGVDSARGPRGDKRPAGERLAACLRHHLGTEVATRRLPACVTLSALHGQAKGQGAAKRDLEVQKELLDSLPHAPPGALGE